MLVAAPLGPRAGTRRTARSAERLAGSNCNPTRDREPDRRSIGQCANEIDPSDLQTVDAGLAEGRAWHPAQTAYRSVAPCRAARNTRSKTAMTHRTTGASSPRHRRGQTGNTRTVRDDSCREIRSRYRRCGRAPRAVPSLSSDDPLQHPTTDVERPRLPAAL